MAPETPKGVSSRLLTMKFMQRAAASGSSNGTPDSALQSSKKRKLGNSSSEGRLSLNMDQAAVQAAINEQQATRQAALDRHVTGDTHWVLNTSLGKEKPTVATKAPLKIKYIGYGDVDTGDDSGDQEDEAQIGRTSTNNYKRSKTMKKEPNASDKNGDGDNSDSNSDASESETSPAGQSSAQGSRSTSRNGSRSRSHSRHRPESVKAKELRDKRKKKDVPLNKISSISSGGNRNFSAQSGSSNSRGGRRT